jgi:hypothetical protein
MCTARREVERGDRIGGWSKNRISINFFRKETAKKERTKKFSSVDTEGVASVINSA